VIVAEGHGQGIGVLLLVSSTIRFYNGRGVHLKKKKMARAFPLTTCPSSPSSRKSIFVVTSFDPLKKRRVMMEDVNVSNVRERWPGW
jgi:hypothetical protein